MALEISTIRLGQGRIGLCPLPGRDAHLAVDIAAIERWGPDTVISLTEASEGQTALIGPGLAEIGVKWVHLPVRDFDVPVGETLGTWTDTEEALRAEIVAGRSVLLHCHGGRGRSGMIALRLMVRAGEDDAAALTRLRARRPGAVETEAQLAWALSRADAP